MLEAIKNACIFLLIAQILMVLVPEEAYAKYVRVLVSLILILKITQPFLILISGREAQEVMQANVEQLYVELSVRELPSSIQRETGNMLPDRLHRSRIYRSRIGRNRIIRNNRWRKR